MAGILTRVNSFVWGVPALILILGVGVWLSFATRFSQITLFPIAFRSFASKLRGGKAEEKGVSSYQTLCTALAATVGTGNIAGVAGAIAIGGPGAIFWMWVCALLGMVTKLAEATLAAHYQRKDPNGQLLGGPMYMIEFGLGNGYRWLAVLYCIFGVIAAFGVGNATQINAVIDGINTAWSAFGGQPSKIVNFLLGISLAGLTAFFLLGGAKRVGKVAEKLVPFAAIAYILLGFGVLIACADQLPKAFCSIFAGAFSPRAVTGGVVGSMATALRVGVSRGVFTNEAGMGTAAISYASAKVNHPVQQGLMGIMEVFLDTIVICTVTALVILCSGVGIYYGVDEGAALTSRAFGCVYGSWVCVPLALFLCCFAFATMLGWGLYGARCAEYLFGHTAWVPFVLLQAVTATLSSVLETGTVWTIAEILNGFMAIPNLIALAGLSPVLVRLLNRYKISAGAGCADGGTNESFNQCQPLRALSHEKVPSHGQGGRKAGKNHLSSEYRSA